jgi:L-lactate dehydrogenase complex protein LldE
MRRVGLFIPCYMDAFEPEVGVATLELLERLGCAVDYPFDQTCCGQPMVNTGCHQEAAATEALFVQNFAGYEYVVCPSGSCAQQVRDNLTPSSRPRPCGGFARTSTSSPNSCMMS